jgi:hypothetical protein
MEKLKQEIRSYQLNANKTYMQYESDGYSQYQNYLYKRALYGLNAVTQEELASMCSKKKQRVINVYKRAQKVLNIFKQQVTNQYSNYVFKTLLPKSPWTDDMLAYSEVDERYTNTLTFKDLNIGKSDIIGIFMSEGILPKNFLSLKEAPLALPRLKNEAKA